MEKRQAKSSDQFLVATAIVLSVVLFTVLQVQQSLFQGQLALPITYDDNVYFSDALRRLGRFYDQGLPRLILDWIERPPHSPTSLLTPLLGFSVFGRHDWAPATANGLYLIGFLFFVAYHTSHLPWVYQITTAFIVLTCPLAGHLIVESRPDVLCGFATACASVSLLKNSQAKARRKEQILAGTLAGLAFLAKPSISPITAIILFSTLFVVAVRDGMFGRRQADSELKDSNPRRLQILTSKIIAVFEVLRRYFFFITITLLISLPHYLLASKQIFDYIYSTIFGANKEIWQTNSPFIEQVLYYVSGPGGKMMFGIWGSVTLIIVVLALTVTILIRDWQSLWRTVPYLAIVGITYGLVTVPLTKSPFLGMAFGGIILLSTLHLFIYLVEVIERRSTWQVYRILGCATCVAIMIVSVSLFQWPWFNKTGLPRSGSVAYVTYERTLLNAVLQRFEEKIENANPQCSPQIAFTTESGYLNGSTLEYQLLQKGLENFTVLPTPIGARKLKEVWQGIRQSDYVVAFSLDNPTRLTWLPIEEVQPQLLKRLDTAQRFKLIETFERPELMGSGKVFLYESAQPCRPLPENPLRN